MAHLEAANQIPEIPVDPRDGPFEVRSGGKGIKACWWNVTLKRAGDVVDMTCLSNPTAFYRQVCPFLLCFWRHINCVLGCFDSSMVCIRTGRSSSRASWRWNGGLRRCRYCSPAGFCSLLSACRGRRLNDTDNKESIGLLIRSPCVHSLFHRSRFNI